jgi:hypothetical protein
MLILTFVFFVVGLYAGGFAAMVLWAMAASSFLLAIE